MTKQKGFLLPKDKGIGDGEFPNYQKTKHKVNRKKPQRKGKPSRTRTVTKGHMTTKQQTMKHEGTTRKTFEEYKIVFHYQDKRGKHKQQETLTVYARDMDDAVSHAMKNRKIKRKPTSTEIKDGLGDVLIKIASKVGGAVGTVSAIKREYHTARLERLANDTQSNNPSRSAVAKRELKRKYPHIYKQIATEEV